MAVSAIAPLPVSYMFNKLRNELGYSASPARLMTGTNARSVIARLRLLDAIVNNVGRYVSIPITVLSRSRRGYTDNEPADWLFQSLRGF